MRHADDAVRALHAGKQPEGAHDVGGKRRKRSEIQPAAQDEAGSIDVKRHAL